VRTLDTIFVQLAEKDYDQGWEFFSELSRWCREELGRRPRSLEKAGEWPAHIMNENVTLQVQKFVPTFAVIGNDGCDVLMHWKWLP
jgi:hypothetical protein